MKNKIIFVFFIVFIILISKVFSNDFIFKTDNTFVSETKLKENINYSQNRWLNYIGYDLIKFINPYIIFGLSKCIVDEHSYARFDYNYRFCYGLLLSSKSLFDYRNIGLGYNVKYLLTDYGNMANYINTNLKENIFSCDLIFYYTISNIIEPNFSIGYLKNSFEKDFDLQNEKKINISIGTKIILTDYLKVNYSASFIAEKSFSVGFEYKFESPKKIQTVKICPQCNQYYYLQSSDYCGFDGCKLEIINIPLNEKIQYADFEN